MFRGEGGDEEPNGPSSSCKILRRHSDRTRVDGQVPLAARRSGKARPKKEAAEKGDTGLLYYITQNFTRHFFSPKRNQALRRGGLLQVLLLYQKQLSVVPVSLAKLLLSDKLVLVVNVHSQHGKVGRRQPNTKKQHRPKTSQPIRARHGAKCLLMLATLTTST